MKRQTESKRKGYGIEPLLVALIFLGGCASTPPSEIPIGLTDQLILEKLDAIGAQTNEVIEGMVLLLRAHKVELEAMKLQLGATHE